MSAKDRLIILVCVVGLAGALVASGMLMRPINQTREDLQLTYHPRATESMPPGIAFWQLAAGSFRGLLVDALWMRHEKLKQDGRHFRARQLAEWITTLQPRFPQVWANRAWDLAYNISVETHTQEERWMWVQAGIKLLRDEAIPLNPNSVLLYRHLAWTYLHKVGMFTDDMHWYYKVQVAAEWTGLLGPPPPGNTEDVLEWFGPIADAADRYWDESRQQMNVQALRAHYPKIDAQIEMLQELGLQPDKELVHRIGWLEARGASFEIDLLPEPSDADLTAAQLDQERINKALTRWLADEEIAESRRVLIAFARADVIRKVHKMDPVYMMELMTSAFGAEEGAALPIDWRHPAAHGVYWASLGVRKSAEIRDIKDKIDRKQVDLLNTDRHVLLALQSLMHTGRIVFDPLTGYYSQSPDERYIEAYEFAKFEAKGRIVTYAFDSGTADDSFDVGHENFLIWAIVQSYMAGDTDKARDLYRRVRKKFSMREGLEADRTPRYQQPLDQFVLNEMLDTSNLDTLDDARMAISGLVRQAIQQGLANNRPEVADRLLDQALKVWDMYQEKRNRHIPGADRNRMGLNQFHDRVADTFQLYLLNRMSNPREILIRSRVWRHAPLEVKVRLYRRIRQELYQLCEKLKINPEAAFPPPPGFEVDSPVPPQAPTAPEAPEDLLEGTPYQE